MRLLLALALACISIGLVVAAQQPSESQQPSDSQPQSSPTLLRERPPPRPASEDRGFGPESVVNFAGYVSVHESRQLWYWFFESRHDPASAPLVIWLSGGPGCSSLIGLFVENGPYRIRRNLSLALRPDSWNQRANVIYLDQPVGTGFSFSNDADDPGPLSEREIADDLYAFTIGFLRQHPQYARSSFFITGESYAGHYIPAFASRIMRGNELFAAQSESESDSSSDPRGPLIRLAGVAIGNGLLDARSQIPTYSTFARDHGLISPQQFESMQAMLPGCLRLIDECSQNSTRGWHRCLKSHVLCTHAQVLPVVYGGVNPYDVRERCGSEPLCYDLRRVDKFLQQSAVRDALGVRAAGGRGHFQQCNMLVNEQLALAGDWNLNFATDLPALLDRGVRVLIYAGDQDFVSAHARTRTGSFGAGSTLKPHLICDPPSPSHFASASVCACL